MRIQYSPSQRKEIIKSWQESGLGKTAYCRQNGLRCSSLDYFIRLEKLEEEAKKEDLVVNPAAPEGFVELQVSEPESVPQFLRIFTPRGLCIEVPL